MEETKEKQEPAPELTRACTPVDDAQWLRIAEGLETLEAMFHAECDPTKREVLWNALAEAKCN